MNKFNIIPLDVEEALALSQVAKHKICPMKCHIPDKKIWWVPKKFIDDKKQFGYYIDYSVCMDCYLKKNSTHKTYTKNDLVPVLSVGMPFNCDEGEYNQSIKYDELDISIIDKDTYELLNMNVENNQIIVTSNKSKINFMILIVCKRENNNGEDGNEDNDEDESPILYTSLYKSKDILENEFSYIQNGIFNNEYNVTIDKLNNYKSSNKEGISVNLKTIKDTELFKLDYFFSNSNHNIKTINIIFKRFTEEEKYKPKLISI